MPKAVGSFPEVRHEIGLHVHPGWSERRDNYQAHGDLPLLIAPISQMLRTGNVNPEMVPLVGSRDCWLVFLSIIANVSHSFTFVCTRRP
jgi:hypothetical protein